MKYRVTRAGKRRIPVQITSRGRICRSELNANSGPQRQVNINNLIHIPRTAAIFDTNNNKSISLCLMNTRSVKNKTSDIFDYICEHKLDLVAITETWLCQNDNSIRSDLCPDGYKLLDHPRTGRHGGGTD